MVFPDDFLHFLKMKKENCRIHQNYLVALRHVRLKTTDNWNNCTSCERQGFVIGRIR